MKILYVNRNSISIVDNKKGTFGRSMYSVDKGNRKKGNRKRFVISICRWKWSLIKSTPVSSLKYPTYTHKHTNFQLAFKRLSCGREKRAHTFNLLHESTNIKYSHTWNKALGISRVFFCCLRDQRKTHAII